MNKIVHAILIDSADKSIKVVQLGDDHLQSAYKLIGCELIEAAVRLPNGDVIYVDEEGLIVPKGTGRFMFNGQIFQGRGLIVNESGEDWTAPHSPVYGLFSKIEFEPGVPEPNFGASEILQALAAGKFKAMEGHDFDAFADAPVSSMICYDMEGWTVLICPGDKGDLHNQALDVHAYLFPSIEADGPQEDAAFELTVEGWSAL